MQALIWEMVTMGIFVFAASFGLYYTAYKKGLVDENDEVTKTSAKIDEKRQPFENLISNPFVKKWLDFGGGYYGTVAFVKLIFIEIEQLQSFFNNWQGTGDFINTLGFDLLIAFFVEQIQSFVAAIIWPTDYLRMFSIFECAAFVAVTYVLYEWAKRTARDKLQAKNVSSEV